MKNFFSLLRQEIYYGREYHSFEELKQAIEVYSLLQSWAYEEKTKLVAFGAIYRAGSENSLKIESVTKAKKNEVDFWTWYAKLEKNKWNRESRLC